MSWPSSIGIAGNSSGGAGGLIIPGSNTPLPLPWLSGKKSLMAIGDSITCDMGPLPHTPANRGTQIITAPAAGAAGLNANGVFIGLIDGDPTIAQGAGTLKWYSATNSISWTANGDTEGRQVVVSAANVAYTLASATAGNALYVMVIFRNHPTLGDTSNSITASGNYNLRNSCSSKSWLGWVNLLRGNPWKFVKDYATPTIKASDWVAARADWATTYTDVTAIMLGTNDVVDNASAVQALADVSTIIQARIAIGSLPIVGCLLPYDQRTSTQTAAVVQFNQGLRDLARLFNIQCWDAWPYLVGDPGPSQTVTISIASPAVVTLTNNFVANTPIVFATSGTLPTGIVAGQVYYVKTPGASSFTICGSVAGAVINTSGSQSGTQSLVDHPAIGVYRVGYTKDGLHPSGLGYYVIAKRAALPVFDLLFNPFEPTVYGGIPFNAGTAPYGNLMPTTMLTGITGTNSGSGTSGHVPTSCTVVRDSGSVITAVTTSPDDVTATPRNDGRPGKYATIVLSNVGGVDGEAVRFRLSAFVSTGWAVGNYFVFEGDLRVSGTGLISVGINGFTQGAGGSALARNACGWFTDTSAISALGNLDGDTVVIPFKSSPLLIEADATNMEFSIITMLLAGGEAVIDIGRNLNIHVVPAPT